MMNCNLMISFATVYGFAILGKIVSIALFNLIPMFIVVKFGGAKITKRLVSAALFVVVVLAILEVVICRDYYAACVIGQTQLGEMVCI